METTWNHKRPGMFVHQGESRMDSVLQAFFLRDYISFLNKEF